MMFFHRAMQKNVKVYDVLLENMQWKPYSFILSLKNQQISFGKKWTWGGWQIPGDGSGHSKRSSESVLFQQTGELF